MSTERKPELLIPASSLEVLKTAVVFGADAVYIGGEAFGLRAKAKNFSGEDMIEGIAFAVGRESKSISNALCRIRTKLKRIIAAPDAAPNHEKTRKGK